MNLRVALRNWLLKPSKAEIANTAGQGKAAAELVWGHVEREWKRRVTRTLGADATSEGVVFTEGLPPGMVAFERPTGHDFGDSRPGELE